MIPRPVADSVDALVAGAIEPDAGAVRRLEVGRAVRTGRHRRRARSCSSTSITATTGSCARPATSAASRCGCGSRACSTCCPTASTTPPSAPPARAARRGAAARRRASGWCPPGDAPVDRRAAPAASSTTSPRCTRRRWGWHDDRRACSRSANRYSFFGPDALACEAALGFPQPVPRIATEGWQRLDDASPELADALRPLRTRAVAAVRRPRRHAHRAPPRRHEVRQPRVRPRRPHDPDRLVADRRGTAAGRDRALARAQPGAHPGRARDATRPSTRTAPRSNVTASTPRRGSSVSSRCASWASCSSSAGRRRSTRPALELAWWRDRTRRHRARARRAR